SVGVGVDEVDLGLHPPLVAERALVGQRFGGAGERARRAEHAQPRDRADVHEGPFLPRRARRREAPRDPEPTTGPLTPYAGRGAACAPSRGSGSPLGRFVPTSNMLLASRPEACAGADEGCSAPPLPAWPG